MRTLILMRHAEAGYANPGQADFDRPLTPRGQEDARSQGAALRERNLIPDIVYCSPANRTRLTWAGVRSAMENELPMDFELHEAEALYNGSHHSNGSHQTLLDFVHEIDGRADIALILAHNPGIHELAQMLCPHQNGQGAALHQNGYPPSSMAIFEFTGRDWFELSPETVTLKNLIVPSRSLV